MSIRDLRPDPVQQAQQDAAEALRAADVSVLELRTPAETQRGAQLLREVWRAAVPPVPANLLQVVQNTGGYAFGAYDDDGRLLGVTLGLLAVFEGQPALHSHITGVLPSGQRRGLGSALKQHQRAWSLSRGIEVVAWTCDPLVRRNVAFNLHALGAEVAHYLPDHYGAMTDGVNKGDESDRLEFVWHLRGPLATEAGRHRLPPREADLPVAVADVDGRPRVTPVSGPRLVALPADVEALRVTAPAAARAWRHAVREALVPALSEGLVPTGLTRAGSLVLEARP